MFSKSYKTGETITIPFEVLNVDSLENCTIWFYFKQLPEDLDTAAVIKKSTDPAIGGVVITDPVIKACQITITPEETENLFDTLTPNGGLISLLAQIKLKEPDGKITVLEEGQLILKRGLIKAR